MYRQRGLKRSSVLNKELYDMPLGGFDEKNYELQRQSNSSASIYRLPNELLTDILLLTIGRPASLLDFDDGSPIQDLMKAVKLGSVCFIWHEVVHGCPRMWGGLHGDMVDKKVVQLLAKSKQAPLVIQCKELRESFWELIMPHFHRWRSFECTSSSSTLFTAMEFFMKHPAPLLENFLCSTGYGTSDHSPSILFANHAPRLQYLCFPAFSFPIDSPILSGLTFLGIPAIQASSYEEHCTKYLTLLELLSSTLEFLAITGHSDPTYISPPTYSSVWTKTIHFPRLTILQLDELPCHIVGLLLSSIRVSQSPAVLVDEVTANEVQDPWGVILAPQSTNNIFLSAISHTHTLKISHSSYSFHLSGKSNTPFYFDGQLVEEEDLSNVDIDFDDRVSSAAGLYAAISNPFCLGQVVQLVLNGKAFFKDVGSISLLLHLDRMESLELSKCSTNVLKFLETLASDVPDQSSRVCRNLRTIKLDGVEGYTMQDLVTFMTIRYPDAGCLVNITPLETLTVVGSTLFEEQGVSLLRSVMGSCKLVI